MELSLTELIDRAVGDRRPNFGSDTFRPVLRKQPRSLPVSRRSWSFSLQRSCIPPTPSQVGIVTLTQWPIVVAREFILGVAIGVVTNFVFEAAQMAGPCWACRWDIRWSTFSIRKPRWTRPWSPCFTNRSPFCCFCNWTCITGSSALSLIALNIFLPAAVNLSRGLTTELLHGMAGVLGTGIQIAAPVLAATLVADVILGFLGKASPQMPLMLLGPALKSMLGVGLLMTVIHYWPPLFQRYFTRICGIH